MTNDITLEKPLLFSNSDLKKLIIPLVFESFLVISMGMIDTVMITEVGEAAVSGVSLVDMLCVLLINIFSALATGGAVITAQFIGSRDRNRACVSASQLIMVGFVSSCAIMIPVLIFKSQFVSLIYGSIEADVMAAAETYLWINAISFPFIAVYNSCASLFRVMGNSKISMYASLCVNIMNVTGNGILIYGVRMGVAGAALSTIFARFAAMIFLLIKLLNHDKNYVFVDLKRFKPDWHIIKKILYIGVPGSLENSFFQLGRVLVVAIIAGFGTSQIAANAVANNLDALGIIPGQAMGLAIITVVGQCVGANDYAQAKFYIKKLMKITYITTATLNLLVLATLPLTLKLYNLPIEALNLAAILVCIHDGCAILLWPLSFTLPNAMRAAGDVKFPMYMSIFSMIVMRILFSYILGSYLNWGAIGIWCAMVMDWIFRVILITIRYKSGKWQRGRLV